MKENLLFPSPINGSSESIEEQMLEALELFQYSFSFRDSVFTILVNKESDFDRLLTDLKVIQSSQIYVLVVINHSIEVLEKVTKLKNDGLLIEYITQDADKNISNKKLHTIKNEFSTHDIVVLGLNCNGICETSTLLREGLEVAEQLNARKFFYLIDDEGVILNGVLHSTIKLTELKSLDRTKSTLNLNDEIIDLFEQSLDRKNSLELVVTNSTPGSLYQEVFTHQGIGTLISNFPEGEIRNGSTKDIFIVSRLMKPYVERGLLLPIPPEDMEKEIFEFQLYIINGSIVAGAKIIDFGEACELAKFFSLPRFRRRGHAKTLAISLIQKAKDKNKKYVFSLSVTKNMWDFFLSLGFSEIERELLPEDWKNNYDFSRNSKAFKLDL